MEGKHIHTVTMKTLQCAHSQTAIYVGVQTKPTCPIQALKFPPKVLILDKCTAKLPSVSSYQLQPLAKH